MSHTRTSKWCLLLLVSTLLLRFTNCADFSGCNQVLQLAAYDKSNISSSTAAQTNFKQALVSSDSGCRQA